MIDQNLPLFYDQIFSDCPLVFDLFPLTRSCFTYLLVCVLLISDTSVLFSNDSSTQKLLLNACSSNFFSWMVRLLSLSKSTPQSYSDEESYFKSKFLLSVSWLVLRIRNLSLLLNRTLSMTLRNFCCLIKCSTSSSYSILSWPVWRIRLYFLLRHRLFRTLKGLRLYNS